MTRYTAYSRLALVLIAATAACGDTTAPGPDPEPDPVPDSPTYERRWDMDVTVRYVRASSDLTCDGETIFGAPNPGEYQYQIRAELGPTAYSMATTRYGSVTGVSHELGPGETYNFANETWSFSNLTESDQVRLAMYVTEWDATEKDDYMNHRGEAENLQPSSLLPTGGTIRDRTLTVGRSTCGLTLVYDIEAVQRQVQVP